MKKRLTILLSLIILVVTMCLPQTAFAYTAKTEQQISATITVSELPTGKYKINWDLKNISTEAYVRIYLTTGTLDENPVQLAETKSGSRGNWTVRIPTDTISGYYRFMLEITTMDGRRASEYSEGVLLNDSKAADILKGVQVGRSESTVYAIWEESVPVVMYLYDAKTKDLIGQQQTTLMPASLKIPDGYTDVVVGVAKVEGNPGRFEPYECLKKNISQVESPFPDTDITNVSTLKIRKSEDTENLRLFKNKEECISNGNGFEVSLDEGMNELLGFVAGKNGIATVIEKTIELDTIPPTLNLEGTGTMISTEKASVFIQGIAEKDSLVTCDKEAVGLVGNCFSIEKKASYGTNTVTLTAKDKAGNVTSFDIKIKRVFLGSTNIWLIVIGLAFFAGLAIEIYLLFIRQRRKNK